MARMTVRIDDDLKRKADAHDEINWSAFMRNQIKRELDHPNPPRKVEQFVDEEILAADHRVELAWALHLMVTVSDERHRTDTAAELFRDADLEGPLATVQRRLADANLDDLTRNVGRDLSVRTALQEELADTGLLEEIRDACRDRVSDVSRKDRDLVWLLAREVSGNSDRETVSVKPHGIGKTHALATSTEYDVDEVTETLTRLGLVYRGYRRTNQYRYQKHRVPNYAMALLEGYVDEDLQLSTSISTPDRRTIRRTLESDEFDEFLQWLDGSRRSVRKHHETEELDESYPGGAEAFEAYARDLIRKGILEVTYRPHRRAKGGNNGARPPKWRYEITRDAFDSLGEVLLKEGVVPRDGS